jgi:hypothetical protein
MPNIVEKATIFDSSLSMVRQSITPPSSFALAFLTLSLELQNLHQCYTTHILVKSSELVHVTARMRECVSSFTFFLTRNMYT